MSITYKLQKLDQSTRTAAEYMSIPETNSKVAFDATEIEITSIIDKRKKHIHHIIPENRMIKNLITLYDKLNIIENK